MFVFVHKTSARYLFFPGNFLIDGKQRFIGAARGWSEIVSIPIQTATVESIVDSRNSSGKASKSSEQIILQRVPGNTCGTRFKRSD